MLKVLKPVEFAEVKEPFFPYCATVKIDGIRAYVHDGVLKTCSNKPIPNRYLSSLPLPEGADLEFFFNDFRQTSSIVMSEGVQPPKGFSVNIFDCMPHEKSGLYSDSPYLTRLAHVKSRIKLPGGSSPFWTLNSTATDPYRLTVPIFGQTTSTLNVSIVRPVTIGSQEDLTRALEKAISLGYEGIMLRQADSLYKFGRSTPLSAELIRCKPTKDAEALVVGFEEMLENTNTPYIDERGRSKRSTDASGLVPKGTLGSFLCRLPCPQCLASSSSPSSPSSLECSSCSPVFSIGNGRGLTHALRQEIWNTRSSYLGRLLKFKYQDVGNYDAPRSGVFLGFRSPLDISL